MGNNMWMGSASMDFPKIDKNIPITDIETFTSIIPSENDTLLWVQGGIIHKFLSDDREVFDRAVSYIRTIKQNQEMDSE